MLILMGALMPRHLLTILFFLGSLSLHPLEGRNRWGRGSWDLEEGRNPEFLRGVEARRGGDELGAGCLGTKQEAGFLVSPPTGPAHPCQLPPVLFSHPNCLLDLSFPQGCRNWEKLLLQQQWRGLKVGKTLGLLISSASIDPQPLALFPPSPPPLQLCQHRN